MAQELEGDSDGDVPYVGEEIPVAVAADEGEIDSRNIPVAVDENMKAEELSTVDPLVALRVRLHKLHTACLKGALEVGPFMKLREKAANVARHSVNPDQLDAVEEILAQFSLESIQEGISSRLDQLNSPKPGRMREDSESVDDSDAFQMLLRSKSRNVGNGDKEVRDEVEFLNEDGDIVNEALKSAPMARKETPEILEKKNSLPSVLGEADNANDENQISEDSSDPSPVQRMGEEEEIVKNKNDSSVEKEQVLSEDKERNGVDEETGNIGKPINISDEGREESPPAVNTDSYTPVDSIERSLEEAAPGIAEDKDEGVSSTELQNNENIMDALLTSPLMFVSPEAEGSRKASDAMSELESFNLLLSGADLEASNTIQPTNVSPVLETRKADKDKYVFSRDLEEKKVLKDSGKQKPKPSQISIVFAKESDPEEKVEKRQGLEKKTDNVVKEKRKTKKEPVAVKSLKKASKTLEAEDDSDIDEFNLLLTETVIPKRKKKKDPLFENPSFVALAYESDEEQANRDAVGVGVSYPSLALEKEPIIANNVEKEKEESVEIRFKLLHGLIDRLDNENKSALEMIESMSDLLKLKTITAGEFEEARQIISRIRPS